LRWPGAFTYAPGHGLTLSFLGFRLIIDEGLFTSRYFKPLLAQQLFAWNSGDVWLRVVFACLAPLAVYVMPLWASSRDWTLFDISVVEEVLARSCVRW
jgi:hypothetical protein